MNPNIQPVKQKIQQKKSSKGPILIYLVAIIIVVGLGSLISSQSQSTLPQGFQKALDYIKANPKLLMRTTISQTYKGTIRSFVPEKSWTLEWNGEIVTINNENNNKVQYFTMVLNVDNPTYQPVSNLVLKTSDIVGITRSFTEDGKNLIIDRVVLGVSPQGAASAPPPSPSVAQK